MDTSRRILAQFQEQFRNMAPGARLQLVVIPLLVLTGLGLVMFYGASPAEEALLMGKAFTSEELKSATGALRHASLHQFRVDGQKILVPKAEAARYNAALITSEAGLPDNFGKEFDKALDPNPFLTGTGTQRGDRMDLARAQVLTKMIKAISYVEDAHVVWFRAPGRSFNSPGKMTALLTVKPRTGNELTSERAQTLRQSVAGCFGMLPTDVTVLDSRTGRTAPFSGANELFQDGYFQAVREYTNHYRNLIADALKDIPHVLVAVNPDIDSLGAMGDPERKAGLTPRSVQATVSVPNDYYRDVLVKQGVAATDKAAFSTRLRRIQSETEHQIVQRVARLIPVASGGTAGDLVTVTSYERLESSEAATPAKIEARIGKAAGEWAGLIGLALFALWALWMLNRTRKRPTEFAAESEAPIATTASIETPLPVGENDQSKILSKRDQLHGLVKNNPELASAVTQEERDEAIEEIGNLGLARAHHGPGGLDYQRVEKGGQAPRDIPMPHAGPFAFLQETSPERLLTFVAEEHAQTIALILSHVPAGLSAAVLAKFPSKKQLDVVRRIATMERASPEVVRDVARSLEARMRSTALSQLVQPGGISAVAQMLNVSNRMTNKAILEHLEQDDPDLVEQIRRQMFAFDDLLLLDDNSLQWLLKEVEPDHWALALKGASPELKAKITGTLSPRVSQRILEEMQFLGPVRVSDVEAAQQQIINAVYCLEDAGGFSEAVGQSELCS